MVELVVEELEECSGAEVVALPEVAGQESEEVRVE